jgi:hypothetical protein
VCVVFAVIARLDRAIQYPEASVIDPRKPGELDAPPARGMTDTCDGAPPNPFLHRRVVHMLRKRELTQHSPMRHSVTQDR